MDFGVRQTWVSPHFTTYQLCGFRQHTSLSVGCHIFKVGIIIPFCIVAMRTLTDNVCVEQCLAYRRGSAQTLEWGDLG